MKEIKTKWGKGVLWDDVLRAFRRAHVWQLKPSGIFGFEKNGKKWMWLDDFTALMMYLKKQRIIRMVLRKQRA